MDITISIITTLVLTVVNGYFSMSEMALTTAKRAVLDHEAEEGDFSLLANALPVGIPAEGYAL